MLACLRAPQVHPTPHQRCCCHEDNTCSCTVQRLDTCITTKQCGVDKNTSRWDVAFMSHGPHETRGEDSTGGRFYLVPAGLSHSSGATVLPARHAVACPSARLSVRTTGLSLACHSSVRATLPGYIPVSMVSADSGIQIKFTQCIWKSERKREWERKEKERERTQLQATITDRKRQAKMYKKPHCICISMNTHWQSERLLLQVASQLQYIAALIKSVEGKLPQGMLLGGCWSELGVAKLSLRMPHWHIHAHSPSWENTCLPAQLQCVHTPQGCMLCK